MCVNVYTSQRNNISLFAPEQTGRGPEDWHDRYVLKYFTHSLMRCWCFACLSSQQCYCVCGHPACWLNGGANYCHFLFVVLFIYTGSLFASILTDFLSNILTFFRAFRIVRCFLLAGHLRILLAVHLSILLAVQSLSGTLMIKRQSSRQHHSVQGPVHVIFMISVCICLFYLYFRYCIVVYHNATEVHELCLVSSLESMSHVSWGLTGNMALLSWMWPCSGAPVSSRLQAGSRGGVDVQASPPGRVPEDAGHRPGVRAGQEGGAGLVRLLLPPPPGPYMCRGLDRRRLNLNIQQQRQHQLMDELVRILESINCDLNPERSSWESTLYPVVL